MRLPHFHRGAIHIDALTLLRNLAGILGFIALILAAMSFSSCSGTRRVAVVADKYPGAFAHACADRFPVRDSVATETKYVAGETMYLPGDTVTVDCDTVRELVPGGARTVRIPCPPVPFRVDTVYKTTISHIENTARVAGLQQDLATQTAAAGRARSWRTAFIIVLIAALLSLYFLSRSWFTQKVRNA